MKNQKGMGLFVVVVVLAVAGAIGFAAYSVATSNSKTPNKVSLSSATKSPEAGRDEQRKKDAAQFAIRLFSQVNVYKKTIPESAQGYTIFSNPAVNDPLIGTPYVYNSNQQSMRVGQITFGIGATCDNKISGSNGVGMIVDGYKDSVAVAIKLESTGYACESSM